MGHQLGRHHRAVRHHPGKARVLFAKQRVAHHRVDAVGADQHIAAVLAAVLEVQADAVVSVLNPLGALGELHLLQREHFGQGSQQVGAVDGQLRGAVLLLGGVGHFQA